MHHLRWAAFLVLLGTLASFTACGGSQGTTDSGPFTTGDEDRLYNEGLAARRGGDLRTAEERFRQSTQANPRYLAAWLALGLLHQDQADWTRAQEAFQTAVNIRSRSADAQAGLARANLELGDAEAAASAARLAVVHAEDGALQDVLGESLRILGAALAHKGEMEEAVLSYERALETDPTNLATRIELARLYDVVDRRPDSVRLLATAAMTAESSDDLVRVGRILIEMGVAARALEPLQRAYTSGMDTDDVLLLLARANLDAGNRDVAIQQAGELIARSPENPEAFLVRGKAQLLRIRSSTSHTAEAMERVMRDARSGLALQPDNPAFHVLLGDAWATQARRDEAVEAYQAALALAPRNAGAIEGLVFLLDPTQSDEATQLLTLLQAQGSVVEARPHWLARMARAENTLGQTESAAQRMSRAARLADTEDLYHLEAAELGLHHSGVLEADVILEHAQRAFDIAGVNSSRHRTVVVDALLAADQRDEALRFVQESLRYLPADPGLMERREALDPRRRR